MLPFGPSKSQIKPSISHVLLFLAIKSNFVYVMLFHDASVSVSVMLMKGRPRESKKGPTGVGVLAGSCLVRGAQGDRRTIVHESQ